MSTPNNAGLPPPVPSNDEKKSEKQLKRERNRERAINELIDTEQTYVNNLRLCMEIYCKPLQNNKIIKQKYIQSVFGEIETIINLNDNLLNTLKNNKENDKIGEAMLQFIPFLKMYQNYINNHESATKLLREKIDNNTEFSNFLTEQSHIPKVKGQSLSSFLILPIQRVPRYELCLKEIIKLTPVHPPHKDLYNLNECYNNICHVNKSINDRINEFHNREKVKSIEQRFAIGQNISLVAPSRIFKREGYLLKVSRKKDIKYLFILFSDLLIYCSQTANNKLKLHQRLEFDLHFKIGKVDNNRKYGNKCFELLSTKKSFLVICENNSIRESWLKDIQLCLDKIRKNRSKMDEISKKRKKNILDVAPVWIPDDFSERCMIPQCMKKFTFTRRRHHCRYCGRLICSSCSKLSLPHFNKLHQNQIVRVGTLCYEKYKQYFPDFDLKVNRKNKSSYSISSTPKGAEYEINWDDDDSSSISDNNNTTIDDSITQQSQQTDIISPTAYKPIIKQKHTHTHSSSINSSMINTMQSKLNLERKRNLELQGQIEDLRAENQRLRKSKVDLMTWSNAEMQKFKKEIQFLKQNKLSEGH